MVTAPEKILVGLLLALLAASILIMELDSGIAVQVARGICVVLCLIILGGVIVPARRHLARQAEKKTAENGRGASDKELE